MSEARLNSVELSQAREWARVSLADGSSLAKRVLLELDKYSKAAIVIPGRMSNTIGTNWDFGRGIKSANADEEMRIFLVEAKNTIKANLLIVENELARRGDPNLLRPFVLIGDRVANWTVLDDEAGSAIDLMRRASSGYPLNALLCSFPEGSNELIGQCEIEYDHIPHIVQSVKAIIVNVFDAETYLILLRSASHDL